MAIPKWIYIATEPKSKRGGGAKKQLTADMAEWQAFIVRPFYAATKNKTKQARANNKHLRSEDELLLVFSKSGKKRLVGRFKLVPSSNPGQVETVPFDRTSHPTIPDCFGKIQDPVLLTGTNYVKDPHLGFYTALCVEQFENRGISELKFTEILNHVEDGNGALRRWDRAVQSWQKATGKKYR